MPHCFSLSANAYRSCVNVGKERTFSSARSAGTATKISVAPMSIPAAFGLITGSTALFDFDPCLRLRAIPFSYAAMATARAAQNGHSSKRDRREPLPALERHHCLEHETSESG